MAWCPVCKCEYKDGIKKCADCNVDLVDSLEALEEESIEKMDFSEMANVFETLDEEELEESEDEENLVIRTKKAGVYQDSAQLSSENKSSAYVLLGVGIVGIIVLILIMLDIIPIYFSLTSKIITSSVMGTLFIVFIVMGILSLKNAKKFEELAVTEGDLSKEIISYCLTNFFAETIDKSLFDEEWENSPEEVKYFKRIEYIRSLIMKQFMNLDDEYVDHMCDEVYTKLYEE